MTDRFSAWNSWLADTRIGLLGLLLCCCAMSATAGFQADRAVAAVKSLISSGEVDSNAVIKLVVKQGNIANFLGNEHELKRVWEQQTGILLDVRIMPQLPSLEYIKSNPNVDITIARNREYPDLVEQQLITELGPLANRFSMPLADDSESGYLLPQYQAYLGDKLVAIPADGDVAVLYIRKDKLEDEANQALYLHRYGEPLQPPQSWQEYQQQVEFFHQPDQEFYGSVEQRDLASGWMFWIPRYTSQSFPNQYLFDEQMRPLIDSPAGVAATESYRATVAYSPPGILKAGNSYTYTLPLFANGYGYSTMITLAGAKVFGLSSSKIKDKFLAVPMPGKRINGEIHRRTTLIYGNNIVIPSSSEQPELAFLFAMWLTDPDISVTGLSVKGGFADPFRYSHFTDPGLQQIYGAQVLDTVAAELDSVVPAGTGLPGDVEYINALNRNLHRVASGTLSASQAMAETSRDWNLITDRYGRELQIKRWKQILKHYPGAVSKP
ncbi:MAG: extracellular solute-binding protein [Motiliproteus sp.]